VAEAGFFPGIVLYLTYWFPARERARAMSYFMVAIALVGAVSSPVNGAIMKYLDGTAGLRGWQWLFLLEGLPSVVLGIVVLVYLTDRPEQAHWLSPVERSWLTNQLQREEQHRQRRHVADLLPALTDRRVWLLIALYFTVAVGANAAGAYFPKDIKALFPEHDTFEIGLLVAVPHVCALVGTLLFAAWSDRTRWRCLPVSVAAALAATGWGLAALAPSSPELTLLGFCLAQTGMLSMLPTFWALPTAFLSGVAAAGGIALINSVANLGGLFGPKILEHFGRWSVAGLLAAGAALALYVQHDSSLDREPAEKPAS
jgi:ACS family tartrate transporter-like MFS transporter